ncbi:MAG: cytochrome b/b6 domain-containing protein [Chthonomonas sp.]|nr:cytochrome b/b6 domain-containing protein [Chthonomonas sp.]
MRTSFGRVLYRAAILAAATIPLFIGFAKAQSTSTDPPKEHVAKQAPDAATKAEIDECMGCHSADAESGPPIKQDHLLNSPHATLGCKTCHASITAAPHTPAMLKDKPACADCHPDESEGYFASVHARPDKVAGDHPTCRTCHGGGDPHSVKLYATWTRDDKVNVCSSCHSEKDRMARYGPNVEAVSSYELSFHGRALLKYGSQETAICVDCHGSHAVRSHLDPKSNTFTTNIAHTCGKCHKGAGPNFSVSGSNHMNLTIHREPILAGVLLFFKVLVSGMATFLMLGVLLDLKRSLFSKTPPRSGRLVGTVVSLGFLSIVVAIAQATFGWRGGTISTLIGASLMLASVFIFKWQNRGKAATASEIYDRFHPSLRIQHMLLVVSFTLLIITGMPVRNPQTELLRRIYLSIGGLEVGRVIHRAAGVLLITVFLFHVFELIWKWKQAGFKWSAWTMLPGKQDLDDFVAESRSYLGNQGTVPAYGRFHFREKLDYFAEYWGIPLMAITGLILWFPVTLGNLLPPIAIPIAFIAHSYEAVLAFIAILTWHLYNTYFNPNHFAQTRPWNIGLLTMEDMHHKHPLEIQAARDGATEKPADEGKPEGEDSSS